MIQDKIRILPHSLCRCANPWVVEVRIESRKKYQQCRQLVCAIKAPKGAQSKSKSIAALSMRGLFRVLTLHWNSAQLSGQKRQGNPRTLL
jgi:hypothetical protein